MSTMTIDRQYSTSTVANATLAFIGWANYFNTKAKEFETLSSIDNIYGISETSAPISYVNRLDALMLFEDSTEFTQLEREEYNQVIERTFKKTGRNMFELL